MKVSITIVSPALVDRRDLMQQVNYAVEAEKLGVDSVWTGEAWGVDAVTPLAYIAAKTERIRLGTSIMQISARAPAMTAMTALTLAALCDNRFILGLGASGPQVVEGLHGRPFKAPLTRMRETVDVIKLAFAGEKIAYDGKQVMLPLPGGEGKAIRLAQPGNDKIPIYLATLAPAALEYTGEAADGWLGTSFTPEHADAHLDYIKAGAARAGRSLTDIDIGADATIAFGDDLETLVRPLKSAMAFQLGAMGSAKTNYYKDAYQRGGWQEAVDEVQRLWKEGKREEATARVPDQLVMEANLLGDEATVRARLQAYKEAGVNTARIRPAGNTLEARLETLGRTLDLIKGLS